MSDVAEIEIPITIECEEADHREGAIWYIKNVIDERTDYSLGDIGIYEFDGFDDDFPEKLINAVLNTLAESDEFEAKENFYSIKVNIVYGGNQLGSASRHFYGWQFSSKREC